MKVKRSTIELRAAAEELGVHYQTAYRWVRTGRLPAQMLGGKYHVAVEDLEELIIERQTPSAPAPPGRRRVAGDAERMHQALVGGDEQDARRIARRLLDEGTSVIELIELTLVPPLRQIGQDWHDGKLSISIEHRAAAIVERVLGELTPNPRGRRRGIAAVASVSGDLHSLPGSMATAALRQTNWNVHHLGADLPGDELFKFCLEHDVDLAVISLTNPDAANHAHETAEQLREAGIATIVGAPGQTLTTLVTQSNARGK